MNAQKMLAKGQLHLTFLLTNHLSEDNYFAVDAPKIRQLQK